MTTTPSTFSTIEVGSVPFQVSDLETATQWLLAEAVPRREGINVRLANAYTVALTRSDPSYRELLTTTGVNFPDGTPVVWFMRLRRGAHRPHRVRGPSLFARALSESAEHGTRHFFLGSTSETLQLLVAKVRAAYPQAVIAGSYSPPFAALDDTYVTDCAEQVRESDANLVWIGLGTPKQDHLGAALAGEMDVVCVNVGAAFDFFAGTVNEAPIWVQKSGFEWFYRLLSEPKRLWRRYLIGNSQFLIAAFTHLAATVRTPAGPR
jgi:N-acetylglucosaminyldiphosphoundecaprenol N-acetyl-beta-D-mannosaminyltransferase